MQNIICINICIMIIIPNDVVFTQQTIFYKIRKKHSLTTQKCVNINWK